MKPLTVGGTTYVYDEIYFFVKTTVGNYIPIVGKKPPTQSSLNKFCVGAWFYPL